MTASLALAGSRSWERPSRGCRLLVATGAGRARAARLRAGGGTEGFLAQHREIVEAVEKQLAGGETRRLRVNAAESPLQFLARRRGRGGRPLIDAAGLEAGERLRRDITMGQILPSVTSRWDPVGGQGAGICLEKVHHAEDAQEGTKAQRDVAGLVRRHSGKGLFLAGQVQEQASAGCAQLLVVSWHRPILSPRRKADGTGATLPRPRNGINVPADG